MSSVISSSDNPNHLFIRNETQFMNEVHNLMKPLFEEDSPLIDTSEALIQELRDSTTLENFNIRKTALTNLYKESLNINYPEYESPFNPREGLQGKERLLSCGVALIEHMLSPMTGRPSQAENRAKAIRLAHHIAQLEEGSSQKALETCLECLASVKKEWVFTLLDTQKTSLQTPVVIGKLAAIFFYHNEFGLMNSLFDRLETSADVEEAIAHAYTELDSIDLATFNGKLNPHIARPIPL